MIAKDLLSILISIEDDISVKYDLFCMGDIDRKTYEKISELLIQKQIKLINQFKKEVCEKQRINIAKAYDYEEGSMEYRKILNVIEPD